MISSRIESSQSSAIPGLVSRLYSNSTVTFIALAALSTVLIYIVRSLYGRIMASPEDLLKQGEAYFNERNYEEAISKYTAALSCNPTNPDLCAIILLYRGDAHSRLKCNDKAILDYTAALEHNPSDKGDLKAEILKKRGCAYPDNGKAIEDFTIALRCNPSNKEGLKASILLHRARAYIRVASDNIKQGRRDDFQFKTRLAIQDYKAALECNPSNGFYVFILLYRASAYGALCCIDGAISDYTAALERCPSDKDARSWILFLRANAYREAGRYDTALIDYTDALEYASDTDLRTRIESSRADAHLILNNKAILEYTAGFKGNRSDKNYYAQILFLAGNAYREAGKKDEAIRDYTAALGCNPASKNFRAKILYHRGNLFRELYQHDKGISDYTAALECNPTDKNLYVQILFHRGELFGLFDNKDEAILDYTAALELDVSDKDMRARIFNKRGRLYWFLKQEDEALKDYVSALECHPSDTNLYGFQLKNT